MKRFYQTIAFLLFTFTQQISAAPLAGTYTIGGASSTYLTIGAAVDSLHANGISAPVTFRIRTGTYNEQITIGSFVRTGAANDRVTFDRFPGNNVVWQFSGQTPSNNWVLKLDGAQYIRIRNIVFNAASSIVADIIRIDSNAANNIITFCAFNGQFTIGTFISLLDSTNHPNHRIESNTFNNARVAINFRAPNTLGNSTGLQIINNTFNSQLIGAVVATTIGAKLIGNTAAGSTVSSPNYTAFELKDSSAIIENNKIEMTKGQYAIRLTDTSGAAPESRIVNNIIALRSQTALAGVYAHSNNISIYHNTIRSTLISAPDLYVVSGAIDVRIKNNIFVNTAGGFAMKVDDGASITSSNFNNLHTTGATVVKWDGVNYANIADYSTATGRGLDSTSKFITFADISGLNDLHLAAPSNSDTDLVATVLPSVSEDFDGDTRGEFGTYMGADEGNVPFISTYTIGGAISGLNGANDFTIRLNNSFDLNISANGSFAFPNHFIDDSSYKVTIETQPDNIPQLCTISNRIGTINGANVTNVLINCVTKYSVGGILAANFAGGTGLVITNNGNNDLSLSSQGPFSFSSLLLDGSAYNVEISSHPDSPDQICTVTNGSGTVSAGAITNIVINCVRVKYSIGGTIDNYLGEGLVLENINGDTLAIPAGTNSFTFTEGVPDLTAYDVSIDTNPSHPNQSCSPFNDNGLVDGEDVTDILITCSTNRYSIGGTVTGYAGGTGLVLSVNSIDGNFFMSISENGSLTFINQLFDGSVYEVFVESQPSNPDQFCTVINGTGTLDGFNITDVVVSCITDSYSIGGTVSGFAGGVGLVLVNNKGDNLTISANGDFTFNTEIDSGDQYGVQIASQPTNPNQFCSVTNASGTVNNVDVNDIVVNCITNTYTIGGTVTGYAGDGLLLVNNKGNALTISANGSFTFSTELDDANTYNVFAATQPTNPNQICSTSNGSGTVDGANITDILVNCITTTYSIGGTVSGFTGGSGLVLTNNDGDDLSISTNGSFTFSSEIDDGSTYNVQIASQPTGPNQICSLTNASGTVNGANITDVIVNCVLTDTYSIGGTVTGYAGGDGLLLVNNKSNTLTISANGSFTFSTELDDANTYNVFAATQPTNPNQICSTSNGSGAVDGANITDILVNCITTTYSIGGTVSGFTGGNGLVLTNNDGDDLSISTNGSFTFSTELDDGSQYNVLVETQPINPNQVCSVSNASGSINAADINNIDINCIDDVDLIFKNNFENLIKTSKAQNVTNNTNPNKSVRGTQIQIIPILSYQGFFVFLLIILFVVAKQRKLKPLLRS